jgi:formate C-acetyltransferase
MLSATYPSCLKTGKDALHGGAEGNGSGIGFGFVADVADSLTGIKKYVFDKKEITLSQLVEMLDNDFKGNENFRQKLLADRDKYGNNKEIPELFKNPHKAHFAV